MQETRRLILEILRERGQATVDDMVRELQARRGQITAVTVRHHLTILQKDGLISSPEMRRRATPGRPQHTYMLTEQATTQFPNNYQRLAAGLLEVIQQHLPAEGVNVILEGVADHMAHDAALPPLPLHERLQLVVDYLTRHGYDAQYEQQPDGYVLHTSNCPYHKVVRGTPALCDMDMRLVAGLLGVVPRRLAHMAAGDSRCSYFIPTSSLSTA